MIVTHCYNNVNDFQALMHGINNKNDGLVCPIRYEKITVAHVSCNSF